MDGFDDVGQVKVIMPLSTKLFAMNMKRVYGECAANIGDCRKRSRNIRNTFASVRQNI